MIFCMESSRAFSWNLHEILHRLRPAVHLQCEKHWFAKLQNFSFIVNPCYLQQERTISGEDCGHSEVPTFPLHSYGRSEVH